MKYYVSNDDVKNSIEYFKNTPFDSDDMLPIFLLTKHLGITTSYAISLQKTKISESQRQEILRSLWMLGGLFDETERWKARCFMFPTAFKKLAMYQPGTDANKYDMAARPRDTIQKKNLKNPVYNDNDSMLTLRSDYKDLIKENFLKGNKISLAQMTAWLFRFTGFEFENKPSEKQFTRVLEKAIKKYFKITKSDFLWLFEDDLSSHRIAPSKDYITGEELRSCFDFDDGKGPELQKADDINPVFSYSITKETVERYLEMNGDNPSERDIFAILKAKKQIVLTGVPGVGKSRYTTILSKIKVGESKFFEKCKTVQFHPNYSYEDFIGSETLRADSGTYVSTMKGSFLSFVDEAKSNDDKNYLFVIDELNRGNIAEIFGETILALDRNYKVTLTKKYDGTNELKIPKNLYIVGTMNTSDRNIAFLDLAIRRRFAFVPLYPNYDFLSEEVILEDIDLGNVLRIINQRIVGVLKDPELILGQSYFIPPIDETGRYVWNYSDFKNQFNFVVLPTLREYSFNEASAISTIVGENLSDVIQDTDDFKTAFESEFSI